MPLSSEQERQTVYIKDILTRRVRWDITAHINYDI